MNTSRSAFNKPRSQKYNYKTQSNTSINRSTSTYQGDNDSIFKKQSRSKHRKSHLQASHIKQPEINVLHSFRNPLQDYTNQLNIDHYKGLSNPTEFQKKEFSYLKRKNRQLQDKVKHQQSQIKSLKLEFKNMINLGKKSSKNHHDDQHLREINLALQQKYNQQNLQLQSLKNEIVNLKNTLENSNITQYNQSKVEQSNVSRRAFYAKNYQIAVQTTKIGKNKSCSNCRQHSEEILIMKQKYSKELCRLQQEVSAFKEKELMIGVLQQQIKNKNDCIDFLRSQLQDFQRNSNTLLQTISILEKKLQEESSNFMPTFTNEQRRYSFGPFNSLKY